MTDDLEARAATPEAMREAAALLPCPFCGGSAVTTVGPAQNRFGTQCNACEVWRDDRCNTKAEAIAAWNRRALATPTDGDAK